MRLNIPEFEIKFFQKCAASTCRIVLLTGLKELISELYAKSPNSPIWNEILQATDNLVLPTFKPTITKLKIAEIFNKHEELEPQKDALIKIFQILKESTKSDKSIVNDTCLNPLSESQIMVVIEVLMQELDPEIFYNTIDELTQCYFADTNPIFIPILKVLITSSGDIAYKDHLDMVRSKISEKKEILAYKEACQNLPEPLKIANLKALLLEKNVYSRSTYKILIGLCQLPNIEEALKEEALKTEPNFCEIIIENFKFFDSYSSPLTEKSDFQGGSLKPGLEKLIVTFFYDYVSDENFSQILNNGWFDVPLFRSITESQKDKLLRCIDFGNLKTFVKVIKILEQLISFKLDRDANISSPALDKEDPSFTVLKELEKSMLDFFYESMTEEQLKKFILSNEFHFLFLNDLTEKRVQKIVQVLTTLENPSYTNWSCFIGVLVQQIAINKEFWGIEQEIYLKTLIKTLYTCAPLDSWDFINKIVENKTLEQGSPIRNAFEYLVEEIKTPQTDLGMWFEETFSNK